MNGEGFMWPAMTVLLVYRLIGEVLVLLTRLPVPGPVVGMLLLFPASSSGRRPAHYCGLRHSKYRASVESP